MPAISLAEILYLEEKQRIAPGTFKRVVDELQQADSGLVLAPFDVGVAQAMTKVPRAMVPEMPDRIIAATAVHRSVPLVTADSQIRATNIPIIW